MTLGKFMLSDLKWLKISTCNCCIFQIDSLPDNNPMKVLMNLTELFEPVVTLLRDPKMCSARQVLAYGLKSLDVLTIVKSDELTYLFFNAITK